MPKKLIKCITPDHGKVREHPHLQVFGALLHDANLWHLNRRSASGAFAVGLFMAFMPVPFQMALAAGAAILFRVNLPISVVLVWVTNPITIPPIFYFSYLVGAWILGTPPISFDIDLSVDCVLRELGEIWHPLLFGCLVCGTLAAAIGYGAIRTLWRWHIVKHHRMRRNRSTASAKQIQSPSETAPAGTSIQSQRRTPS